MKRIQAIDFVRGLVMIIMTLDHTRDFLHINALTQQPTDLATTTPALFFTRWITHLCAPTFVFLSGTSAFLSLKSHNNLEESRQFLLKRGVWLIIVNFTINNFGIFFDPTLSVLFSQVIATIGCGFIILSLLLRLPARAIGIIGLFVIFGHNLLQNVSFPQHQALNFIWTYLMGIGYFHITPHTGFLVSYAIIPWTAILLAGFWFGNMLAQSDKNLRKKLFVIGAATLVGFVLIRFINIYGDPSMWSVQKDTVFTFLSFINTTKQPPSLLFVLMTLGMAILLLAIFFNINNKFTNWVATYGKVPLFYWLIHWYVLHFVAMGYYLMRGYHWADLQFKGFGFGRPEDGSGLSLAQTYFVWISVVLVLYPAVYWYSRYKLSNKDKKWLRYL